MELTIHDSFGLYINVMMSMHEMFLGSVVCRSSTVSWCWCAVS